MQSYTEIPASETLRNSRQKLLDNDKTAISCNSGSAFPTVNLQPGMLCFRTDEQKLYQLNANGETWVELFDLSGNIGLVSRATTADNALEVNGHTVNSDVPVNAKFTDTTYGAVTDSASGLMTAAQKKKLDDLSNYSLPVASATTLGGVKVGDGLTITDGILSSSVTGGNATHGEQLFTANGTFVVPEGVSILVVSAVGGGGGGGGSEQRFGNGFGGAGGARGVRGEACDWATLFVTPLASYQIYIGAGGAGGQVRGGGGGGVGIANGGGGANGTDPGNIGSHVGGGGGGGGGATGIANIVLARGGTGGTGGGAGGIGGTGGTKTLAISSITTSKHLNPIYGAAGGGGSGGASGGKGASGCVYIVW